MLVSNLAPCVEQPCVGAGNVWEDLSTRQFHCCLPLPTVGALILALPHLQNESSGGE